MLWHTLDVPSDLTSQLDELAHRFGTPVIQNIVLEMPNFAMPLADHETALPVGGLFAPLGKGDRYGEVCMVVRRTDGTLITARKIYYPKQAFRLLTGGISHGETIYDALLRETHEETGLDVAVREFLAAVSYRVAGELAPLFYTFAFLLDEVGGTLGAIDEQEQVEDFGFVLPKQLPEIATTLEQLSGDDPHEIAGSWGDWGKFRAVTHRLVAQKVAMRTED